MHHIQLSQLVLESFNKLPLIVSFVKSGGVGMIKIVIRRDPKTKTYWRCTYDLTADGAVPKKLSKSDKDEGAL